MEALWADGKFSHPKAYIKVAKLRGYKTKPQKFYLELLGHGAPQETFLFSIFFFIKKKASIYLFRSIFPPKSVHLAFRVLPAIVIYSVRVK